MGLYIHPQRFLITVDFIGYRLFVETMHKEIRSSNTYGYYGIPRIHDGYRRRALLDPSPVSHRTYYKDHQIELNGYKQSHVIVRSLDLEAVFHIGYVEVDISDLENIKYNIVDNRDDKVKEHNPYKP